MNEEKKGIPAGTTCVFINQHWVPTKNTPFCDAMANRVFRAVVKQLRDAPGSVLPYNHHKFKVQR